MEVAQSLAERIEQFASDGHIGINRPCVRDVEAEPRVWEVVEQWLQLIDRPSRDLAAIHVLEHELAAERAIRERIHNRVRCITMASASGAKRIRRATASPPVVDAPWKDRGC